MHRRSGSCAAKQHRCEHKRTCSGCGSSSPVAPRVRQRHRRSCTGAAAVGAAGARRRVAVGADPLVFQVFFIVVFALPCRQPGDGWQRARGFRHKRCARGLGSFSSAHGQTLQVPLASWCHFAMFVVNHWRKGFSFPLFLSLSFVFLPFVVVFSHSSRFSFSFLFVFFGLLSGGESQRCCTRCGHRRCASITGKSASREANATAPRHRSRRQYASLPRSWARLFRVRYSVAGTRCPTKT